MLMARLPERGHDVRSGAGSAQKVAITMSEDRRTPKTGEIAPNVANSAHKMNSYPWQYLGHISSSSACRGLCVCAQANQLTGLNRSPHQRRGPLRRNSAYYAQLERRFPQLSLRSPGPPSDTEDAQVAA
jgi:hypothetical protein